MKIYPDPELPDLDVEWNTEDCSADTPEVSISLVAVDEGTIIEQVVPCDMLKTTLKDVDRKRYRIDGALLYADGTVFSSSNGEADLRNGISDDVYLYFGGSAYFRVAWDFASGASCASLDADTMLDRASERPHEPVPDAKYDVILALDVLEHLPKEELTIAVDKLIKLKHAKTIVVMSAPFGRTATHPMHLDASEYTKQQVERLNQEYTP